MPNIRRQTVDTAGVRALEIVGSDGSVFTVTKAEVRAFYLTTSGSAASRRAQVITWMKNNIVTALGVAQVSLAELDFDFSTTDGAITRAAIRDL